MTKQLGEPPSVTKTEEKSMQSWTASEKESSRELYGCEILIENGTPEQIKCKDVPNDSMIVTYVIDGQTRYDLTRSQKAVRIFDMYWDKFREGLKSIVYGYGTLNPKLWGEKPKTKNKK